MASKHGTVEKEFISEEEQNEFGKLKPPLTPLPKLFNISKDGDKSEAALLRSRIDEQSQLIMILKRRSDDALLTTRSLEKINDELKKYKDSAAAEVEMISKKYAMLEMRFADLASNHEEMIQIKDEYKRRNKELTDSNSKLKDENRMKFSSTIVERDEKIVELERNVVDLLLQNTSTNEKLVQTEKLLRDTERQFQLFKKESESNLRKTEHRLKDRILELEQQQSESCTTGSEIQMALAKISKEKDELLELAISRGKLIQDKQLENKRLEQRVNTAEKIMHDMKEKFERDLAAVSVNKQVQKYRQELENLQFHHDNTVREFEAFKKHSQNLLQEEKELNERLRHVIG